MRARLTEVAERARARGSAVPAFTCYDFLTATSVVAAGENTGGPVVLLVSPSTAAGTGGLAFIRALRTLADHAEVPVCVQLDHATEIDLIAGAVEAGVDAVLADGSTVGEDANADFVRAAKALSRGFPYLVVEAELGRIEGHEDIAEINLRAAGALTDPERVGPFLERSGADLLAVSIGNVHGPYAVAPRLEWTRLTALRAATDVPLVLHGASGVPGDDLARAISGGVCKVNINTELRQTVFDTLTRSMPPCRDNGLNLGVLLGDWYAAACQRATVTMSTLAGVGGRVP